MAGVLEAAAALADAHLHRQVELARAGGGPLPHDFAGLVLDEAEIDHLLRSAEMGPDGPSALPPAGDPSGSAWEALVADRRAALAVALGSPDDPLARIARGAGVDGVAAELLAVLTAVEGDARRQRLVAYVQNNVGAVRPSLALVERLYGVAGLAAVAPGGPLDRAALLCFEADTTWALGRVGVPASVCWGAKGVVVHETDLPPDVQLHPAPVGADAAGAPLRARVLLVHRGDRVSRRRAVQAAVALAVVECPSPPTASAGWEALVRYATVTDAAVVLEVTAITAEVRHWVERTPQLCWVLSAPHELPLADLPRRGWVELDVDDGLPADEDWQAALGVDALPGWRLDHAQLELVGGALTGLGGDVGVAVRRLASGDLHQFTHRIRPGRSWDELVLAEDQRAALRHLCDRYRHRRTVYDRWGFRPVPSTGVTALFAGESGTGKTMAAEIVAGELGLDVYKLDLDSVLSKWIGETEQNLARVFAAAETSDVLLFFDEADALFGKRSSVSDAHDRYANIEVAYLLQRLERHDGLVVLATNLQQNIDVAFLRRLHVVVEFTMPSVEERLRIWRQSFPSAAPLGAIDLDDLAERWELSGGSIRNAALYAAFAAAAEGTDIEARHGRLGVERELRKLGRLLTVHGGRERARRGEEVVVAAAAR